MKIPLPLLEKATARTGYLYLEGDSLKKKIFFYQKEIGEPLDDSFNAFFHTF